MKILLTVFYVIAVLNVFSQDSLRIKQIDSIVSNINTSSLTVQRDTLKQNHPEFGIEMTTCLAAVINGQELIKYVNQVNAIRKENGVSKQTISSNTFYYEHNELIKVEEYITEGNVKIDAKWYYSNGKPLYYSLKSEKAEERAYFLLTLSKQMLKQVIKSAN